MTVTHVHDQHTAKVIVLAKIQSVSNVGKRVIFEVVKRVRRKVLRTLTRRGRKMKSRKCPSLGR